MLDQTEVNPTNGHTELPPRAMARSTSELLHDMATLAELQGKLALLDLREGFTSSSFPPGSQSWVRASASAACRLRS